VHLLDGGIADTPEASLDRLCKLALEAQIYRECQRYYPFVLGAQPVRPVDLAAFYAAIANEGVRPSPYVIEAIERNGLTVYRHDPKATTTIASIDRAAFYQLKTMMQGVLARGTARTIANLSPFVAGKTGTSDDENDAWFVGFSNDVTVAVWIGYDNATGKRRTLGGGATGGHVAVPIFEPVMQAVWANVAPRTVLAPPSPEAKRYLACRATDLESGEMVERGAGGARGGITECFRIDRSGQVIDTQYNLVSRESAEYDRESRGYYYSVAPNPSPFFSPRPNGGYYAQPPSGYYYYDNNGRTLQGPRDSRQQPPPQQYYYGQRDPRVQRDQYGRELQAPQRMDPSNLWGNRRFY
jgi:penicillin-binding protein 1A